MQGSYSCSAKISCACVPPRLCFFHVRYFMLLKKIMIPAFLSASLLGNLTLAHAGNVSQDCSRMNGQITVRGYGNAKALPDEALLDLSAAALHKDLKEARSACEKKSIPCLRLVRASEDWSMDDVVCVDSVDEAAQWLKGTNGNILAATGSKELKAYTQIPGFEERVYARVLSLPEVARECADLGFTGKHLICMQGPFPWR